jgi:hypothetical protein
MENPLNLLVYLFAAFLAALQLIILWKMLNDKIPLRFLLAGEDGHASLSRFQFLLFTFVIVVGFLYLTVTGEAFPKIDEGVLILLGISSASYALGKGLDKQGPQPTVEKLEVMSSTTGQRETGAVGGE